MIGFNWPRVTSGLSLRPALAVGVLGLVLAACGSPSDSAATPTEPPTDSTTTTVGNTNAPSTTATSTAPTTTTTADEPEVVLASDGLGVVDFGSEPQATVDALAAVLGSPDEDSGWVEYSDHQPGLGYCGGEEWRVVRWGQLGVVFTDEVDADYAPEGARHFDTYAYGWWSDVAPDEHPLRTSAGLALDDTRDETLELYGESATFYAGNEILEPYVTIDLGDVYPILAILDGDTSTVISIGGGSSCGE